MVEKLIFCAECRNDVTYTVTEEKMAGTLKRECYEYVGKVAHCNDCGEEVFVAEVNDSNLKALYDTYREKNGIISLKKIMEIPSKYNIGKRPLSLLLGWGELTFTRYYEGDMPTKQYAEILQRIYDDSSYYSAILEQNKANLNSTAAYEKSKKTVDQIVGLQNDHVSKIDLVIGYLLHKCEDITPLALQKALYYVQGYYFSFYNSFIFEEDCEAWVHGPVYREIYNRYSNYRFDQIEKSNDLDATVFSVPEKSIIDSVVKNICCYSGKILEEFTHSEKPWIETRGDLSADVASSRIIKKELMGDYFSAVKEKYQMLTPMDIKVYSQKMFEQLS